MTKGVIKKVVMTASLGLALFFSGTAPAAAAVDLVFVNCLFDVEAGEYRVNVVDTSSGTELPAKLREGGKCLNAIKALLRAGCIDGFGRPIDNVITPETNEFIVRIITERKDIRRMTKIPTNINITATCS